MRPVESKAGSLPRLMGQSIIASFPRLPCTVPDLCPPKASIEWKDRPKYRNNLVEKIAEKVTIFIKVAPYLE